MSPRRNPFDTSFMKLLTKSTSAYEETKQVETAPANGLKILMREIIHNGNTQSYTEHELNTPLPPSRNPPPPR